MQRKDHNIFIQGMAVLTRRFLFSNKFDPIELGSFWIQIIGIVVYIKLLKLKFSPGQDKRYLSRYMTTLYVLKELALKLNSIIFT